MSVDRRPFGARPASPAGRRRGRAVLRRRLPGLATVFLVGGVALAARLIRIRQSYDLFIDEVSYAKLGESLAAGGGLVLNGQPFFLHPPTFFLEIAAVLRVSGRHADLAGTILATRTLDAGLGTLNVVLVVVLLLRVTRPRVAAAGGLLLALDPFLNRFDSRLLLEAPAMAPATAGVLVLTVAGGTRRRAVLAGVAAGALFAISATTKDLYVFVGVVPVAVLAAVVRGPRRAAYAGAVVSTVVGYGVYLATVVAQGSGGAWWDAKTVGLRRVVGVDQQTGFNRPGNPSLTSRLLANVTTDALSYGLIVVGSLSTALLAWWVLRLIRRGRDSDPRIALVTAWCGGAVVLLSYEVLFGTLEEQMFYPLLVTSVAALGTGVEVALRRFPVADRASGIHRRPVALGLAGVLLVGGLSLDVASWVRVHTRRDDSYVQLLAWTRANIPQGSVVSATEDVAQFLLTDVRIGQWATVGQLVGNHVDYVVVSTSLVNQGYGLARPDFLRTLSARAVLVDTERGRTAGELRVYDVRGLVSVTAGRTPNAPGPVHGPTPTSSLPPPPPTPTTRPTPHRPTTTPSSPPPAREPGSGLAPLPPAPTVKAFPTGRG